VSKKRIGLLLGLGFLVAAAAFAVFILVDKDAPEAFLEDDPAIRAHPNYPVRVVPVGAQAKDMVIETNRAVTVRDGTRLSANVYRPKAPGKYPVVMALTAYDKNRGPDQYPKILRNGLKPEFDLGPYTVSALTPWEGPDPAFWVRHGYVVVYVDSRGFASSEGSPGLLSMQDRDDFHDAIKWAGTQNWSNGKVGLIGVSYLAIAQWVAASGAPPPHLKAIVPWEGQSDNLREVLYHGGIPETAFTGFWVRKIRSGANGRPVPHPILFRIAHRRPWLMKWFRSRPGNKSGIDLASIKVPALIAATWSDQGLHTRGSFEAFKRISSRQKWLFTHGRSKWKTFYSQEALATQRAFFDHFLKGLDNGFDKRKPVRLEVRETLTKFTVRFEDGWPIPRTQYRKLYLDAGTKRLAGALRGGAKSVAYAPMSGRAQFTLTFAEDTELSGNMKLKLWVSTDRGSDMDLFVGVEKLNAAGKVVPFYAKTGFTKGPVAMGWLRVSQRTLDKAKSTPWQPVLAHGEASPIKSNQIVPVEIEILPSSTLFRKGETLRLTVQGRDLFRHPTLGHAYSVNKGTHRIHTGGAYDSHLLVPVVPAPINKSAPE